MSVIICATGPIDSGKTEFCNKVREVQPGSIGFESGQLIIELANECNLYLHVESKKITEGDNFFKAFNAALTKLEENHPNIFGEDCDINFYASDLLAHPEQFEMLEQYLQAVRLQPDLLTTRINEDNKDLYYRPLLKWIGGYMVFKVRPTIWFDEIGRRIQRFKPAPELITVNALRYPTDETTMRNFAASNGHSCIIVEVQRPGMAEGTDVTEASRTEIKADVKVVNNGDLKKLGEIAKELLHDLSKNKLKPEY